VPRTEKAPPALVRLRKICLALPDADEGMAWGHPAFRVGGRIFCVYENIKGTWTVGFRVTLLDADFREKEPGVISVMRRGRDGGLFIDAARVDWAAIRDDIGDSYRMVAPRRSLAKLEPSRARSRRSS
jgi:YjbR protein